MSQPEPLSNPEQSVGIPEGWRLADGWDEIHAAPRLGHETSGGFTVYDDPRIAIDAHFITGTTGRLSRLYVEDRAI